MKLKYSSAFERYELTLRADHLEPASSALVGVQAGAPIFYDEISAVYRFRQPDWSALLSTFLVLVIFGVVGLALYFGMDLKGIGPLFWLFGLVLAGYFIYAGFIRQKPIVRIIAAHTVLEFPCKNDEFFQALLSHLNIVKTQPVPHETRLPSDMQQL